MPTFDTAGPYKGFWDPSKSYREGDIAKYYSASTAETPYTKTDYYRCKSSASPVQINNYNDCPLQDFAFPVVNSMGEVANPQVIGVGTGDNLRVLGVGDFHVDGVIRTSWVSFKYYSVGVWDGPNGAGSFSIGGKWEKLTEDLTSQQAAIDEQEFGATELTTAGVGLYDGIPGMSTVTFDEIVDSPDGGELESDSYYISNVQNYSGYWSAAGNYSQFDVVRHDKTNAFYYAKTDIASTVNPYSKTFGTATILPPEQPMAANHVGSIRVFEAHEFKRGQMVELSGGQYKVADASGALIVLCSTGPITSDDIFSYKVETDLVITAVHGDGLSLDSNDEWSSNSFFFDPDYGSSVRFVANNSQYDYGDGYKTIRPRGINSLTAEFNLKFSNRTSREATSILHFLENKLGQHEVDKRSNYLEYDLGISGFKMDDNSLFFPYRNNSNLIKNFYSFNFKHKMDGENVHSVDATIFNNDTSILNRNSCLYVNSPGAYSEEENYIKHDVVYVQEKDAYYYYYADQNSQGSPPNVGADSVNKDRWTREFYWKPSMTFNISHSPSIDEISSKSSSYTQYHPANKNNINMMNFDVKFENRNDEEAYSILHFLESRLGYRSFLYIPPAPYNRKRRFVCQGWTHDYKFYNNHTITAKFEQYSLGQNTPLDDDEMDTLAVSVEESEPNLVTVGEVVLVSSEVPADDKKFFLKNQIEIKNIGEKAATGITLASLPVDSKFSVSNLGSYKSVVVSNDNEMMRVSGETNYENDEGGTFIYKEGGVIKAQDNLGRIGAVTEVVSNGEVTSTYSRNSSGEVHKSQDFLETKTALDPGESAYLEVYFEQAHGTAKEAHHETLTITYDNGGTYDTGLIANVANQSLDDVTIDVDIDGPQLPDDPNEPGFYVKTYMFEDNDEMCIVDESDSFTNAQYTATFNAGMLAEPRSADELTSIHDAAHVSGELAIGVHSIGDSPSGFKWVYGSDGSDVPGSVYGEAAAEKQFLVLDVESGSLAARSLVFPIDGAVIEYRDFDSNFMDINLKDKLMSQLSGSVLTQVKVVNFNITGVVAASSALQPALRSGSGYPPGCSVNIKIGSVGSPGWIIGRGGAGGDGLITEGLARQGNNSLISKDSIDFSTSGNHGGDAVLLEELHSKVNFTITLGSGSKIWAGGGGGSGGAWDEDGVSSADKKGKINFGGGGGGGSPLGHGGQGLGSPGGTSSGGTGGKAVNNSKNSSCWVKDGYSGGEPGENGNDGKAGSAHRHLVSGGKAGKSIKYYVKNSITNLSSLTGDDILGDVDGPI